MTMLLQMKKKEARKTVATREYTINLHKRLHGVTFKKKAPQAVKEIKKFAKKMMGTADVRVDVKLNKAVWSQVSSRLWATSFTSQEALHSTAPAERGGDPAAEVPPPRPPTARRASAASPTSCALSSLGGGMMTRMTRRRCTPWSLWLRTRPRARASPCWRHERLAVDRSNKRVN